MSNCIYCGAELPEGFGWVCSNCENKFLKKEQTLVGICCSCQKSVRVDLKNEIVFNEFDRGYAKTFARCHICGDEIEIEGLENSNLAKQAAAKAGTEFFCRTGGYHSEGEGWDPLGNYCGECNKACCSECYHWKEDHWSMKLEK